VKVLFFKEEPVLEEHVSDTESVIVFGGLSSKAHPQSLMPVFEYELLIRSN
jgi:hypothetical protein